MGSDTAVRAVRLGDVCKKIGSGATPLGGSEVYVSSGIALIRSQNVYNETFEPAGLAYICDKHALELAHVAVEEDDVLLNITGDSVARCCLVPRAILPARVNQHVAIIRPDPDRLDARYLRYFLVNGDMQQHMLALAGAGATRNAMTKGMIEDFLIPAPRISVQKSIARILGTLDDKIELNRRMNETLEAMARATFKSWFVDCDPVHAKHAGRRPVLPAPQSEASRQAGGLDPATAALFPDSFQDSELGKIPKGWSVRKLGDLAAINERSITARYPHQAIEYIDISSVTVGKLSGTTSYVLRDAPSRARRLVAHGDTIWSCVRPNRKSYLFIHDPAPNLVVSTGFAVLTPKDVPPSYLYAWVTTDAFVEYLSYSADGSAYPAVRPDRFSDAEMLLPSQPILGKFEQCVAPMHGRIAHNERESRTLAAIRDALLPKLLAGEIRVKDAEKFVGDRV